MSEVSLIYSEKPHKGEKWTLEQTSEGLNLYDQEDQLVTLIPNVDAGQRVKFPSFLASVAKLTIIDDDKNYHLFESDKETLAQVREMVTARLSQAGSAPLRKKALREMMIGAGLFVLGLALTIVSLLSADPGGRFFVMTGLLVFGFAGMVKGAYDYVKAGKFGSTETEAA